MAERAHPEDPGFREGSPYRANLLKRYAFANRFSLDKVVLDIPCGVGWGTSLLKAARRIGIDICPDAIAYAKAHYRDIDFLAGDMASVPLGDDSVDVVVCLEGFEHVSRKVGQQFLAEVVRVTRPDGLLVMTVPVVLPGGEHSGNPYHLYEPPLEELKDLLAGEFQTELMDLVDGADGPVVYFVGRARAQSDVAKPLRVRSSVNAGARRGGNVLLTTSAAPGQSPFSTKEKRPPLGIGFLISVLRNAGHKVSFIDNYLQPSDFIETGYLQQNGIDFVGIYSNTICFRDTLRMLHAIEDLRRTHQWQGKIAVGGPHAAVAPQTIPDFVDYVVQGEGEYAIRDIVEGKVNERLVRYPRIENLDELPMPAWDCFADLPYNWNVNFFDGGPVFTMNTSRGCPFQCTFCSVGSVWGKRYTCFTADRIVSDIEYLIQNHEARGIYFREDNFTLDERRLRRFCGLMMDKGVRIPWVCESRVSTLTRELVQLMVQAGLKGLYFGVESGSQRMLDFMQKGINIEQIENAFRWCHEFDVKTAASVVVGIPGETQEDLTATQGLLQRINPTVTWPNIFVGIPDSRLYQSVLQNRAYEYIDDRGLAYLPGHNERVRQYYGQGWNARIPNEEDSKDYTNPPKISVLMAVHNGRPFLRQALQSIYNQTYRDFEVVIVDDASSDETAEILLEMKDTRTFIYRNGENQGLTKSLNRGLRLCRGEYVARMDADDVSHTGRLDRQVQFLDQHPDVALVGSSYYRIDAEGIIAAHVKVPTEDDRIREMMRQKCAFGHGTVMARRSVLVECGGYDERFVCAQDYDLWLRISEKHKLANLAEPLYGWRSTPQCISNARAREQKRYKELALREARSRRGMADGSATRRSEPVAGVSPLVSVIVPTYNRPDVLKRAIASVLDQTYRNVEIVVVNDAGAGVEHLVEELNTRDNLLYVRHVKNRGLAAARNTGIRVSHGKYIAYLDDDDIYYPDHIERLVTVLEATDHKVAHTEAHRSHQEKRDGRYVEIQKTNPYSLDVDHEGLLVRNLVPVLCVMHEKACLDDVGCFDETLPTHEDWDLWIRMSRRYRFLHVKQVTAQVTWRNDGSTMTSRKRQEFVTVPQRIYEKYKHLASDKPAVQAEQRKRLETLTGGQGASPSPVLAGVGDRVEGQDPERENQRNAQSVLAQRTQLTGGPTVRTGPLKVAIKICTPSREMPLWGDTWFGQGLAKAVARAGHTCDMHFQNEWDQPDRDVDVAIHIKGKFAYSPKPHCVNILWIISHPELHTVEEINRYDAVFCASRSYWERIKSKVGVPCFYLPQATDSELFRPLDPAPAQDIDVLFVGTNYGQGKGRRIVRDVLATGKDYNLAVIGLFWKGRIDERYIKAEYVDPRELPGLYSRARIVLNSHHGTMQTNGFINNRTYDVAAVRGFQISDEVEGLDELGVVTYRTPADLAEKLDYYLAHDAEREKAATRTHERCRDFTFTQVAKTILGQARQVRDRKTVSSKESSVSHAAVVPAAHRQLPQAPKVSVVVACHNCAEFLSECVDSILAQTLSQWELFLLDDGSTDGTRRLIEECARRDARIRPHLFDDNRGPYVRRNFAIERANAPFIVIQDGDDLMSPVKLETLYNEISSDDALAMVGSFYRTFLERFQTLEHTDSIELALRHDEIAERMLAWRHGVSHISGIIRKSMFERIGPYDENPFASDSFWSAKLAEYARHCPDVRFKNVPAYLTLYRVHGTSQTQVLSTVDPRNRRVRYRQYCECKLQKIREQAAACPTLDVAAALRACDCSDFLTRFKAQIIKWESEPVPPEVTRHLLETVAALFNNRAYVSCVSFLNGIETMDREIPPRFLNFDLLKAMALYALDAKESSLSRLRREIENHENPAAREFLRDFFEKGRTQDVQEWCAEHAGRFSLAIEETRCSGSGAFGSPAGASQKLERCL